MSFQTQLAADVAAIFAGGEAGVESITYTPADISIPAFSTRARFQDVALDKVINQNLVGNMAECRIPHALLAAGGISRPTQRLSRQPGDTITRTGLDGAAEVWEIVGADPAISGIWSLTLERDVRLAL